MLPVGVPETRASITIRTVIKMCFYLAKDRFSNWEHKSAGDLFERPRAYD